MRLQVVFRQPALAELRYYENRRLGLGTEFIDETERCIMLAAEQPLAYPILHNSMRRIVTRRFPFTIYFCLEEKQIVITAIFHSSRNPAIWHKR